MGKYYFHVRAGDEIFRDEEGVELANLDALLIRETLREIIEDQGGPFPDEQRVLEVVDSRGNVVLSLPFTAAYKLD